MRGRSGGFSLLEMLLVLFVIVVMTSLATLDVGSGSRELEGQVRALRGSAAYALEEAQFNGRDIGILLQRGGDAQGEEQLWLRWRERLPQGWRPVERAQEVFEDMAVPRSVELELLLDGTLVLIGDEAAGRERSGVEPQWLLYASGETASGELIWRDADDGRMLWRLQWDALGRFELYSGEDGDALSDAPL